MSTSQDGPARRPLEGLRVIDCASIFAGPMVATIMADFGADVIKIEHPRGDTLRSWGWQKDGVSLWWALCGRNKRTVGLKLSDPDGQELLLRLAAEADVFIENFRPGTLERWNLSPERLQERNPGLVIVRTTGFGQTGPYKDRPGFGTLAEAMSGFAEINGWPDMPPALPSFALGDAVATLTGCFAAMFCLWWREHGGQGRGQVVDLSIIEPLFWILGPQASVYDQLGIVQGRTGNRTSFTAPRNAFQAADGRWLALSASAQSIAERVMRLVGRPDFVAEPWFADAPGRLEHVDELDEAIQAWIGARTSEQVLAAFEAAEAAIAPIYSIADIAEDPHFRAREVITRVDHERLGSLAMQNVIVQLSETPGRVEFPGPELGRHTREVLHGELGVPEEELDRLATQGTIALADEAAHPSPAPPAAPSSSSSDGARPGAWGEPTHELYVSRGIGGTVGFGERPALLVIDMAKAFCDPAYGVGCEMDETLEQIARLLDAARPARCPVVFTTVAYDAANPQADAGVWGVKIPALLELTDDDPNATAIHERIAPVRGETVLNKKRSSAFFQTNLQALLAWHGVDTLVLTGCSTSGCIRATALDGVSHGYRVIVPREAVADRAPGPHEANLFDIDAKLGDVVDVATVAHRLRALGPRGDAAAVGGEGRAAHPPPRSER
jgi:crotonobetainyl-CoA:carnitine CoA-transferase CaiB-like acyl-CoA transferase/nicotinamidase-related amidase